MLIAGWLVLAALGGLVAAAALCCDRAKDCRCNYKEEPPAKADIPGDEDPNSGQEMDEDDDSIFENAPVDSIGSGSKSAVLPMDGSVLMKVSQKARFPRSTGWKRSGRGNGDGEESSEGFHSRW